MINVALFGLGRIGQMHADNLIANPNFNLKYIFDIDLKLSKKLSKKTGLPWFDITKKVEETTARIMKNRKEKDIFPNVDLYSASVYYMLGIPMDLNTPIFAISRVSGWTAHVIEEKFAEAAPKPMLYRPKATYVGKYEGPQGCTYIPIENRK